jgi:Rieske Fe-S protein
MIPDTGRVTESCLRADPETTDHEEETMATQPICAHPGCSCPVDPKHDTCNEDRRHP